MPNPLTQLLVWLNEAIDANIPEPTAMVLATATKEGQPSSRTVLLKQFDEKGLVFFTNYDSRKTHELMENPRSSATFLWMPLKRQVTIEGVVAKIPDEESDSYFATRPRGSQLSSWASHQGKVIPSRESLKEKYAEYDAQFGNKTIPRPPFWGGFRLTPHRFEFWQGRENRLHDRFEYQRESSGEWVVQRLSP